MTVTPAKMCVKRGKIGEAGRGQSFGQTHTHTRTRAKKSLRNNGQEDPILVVNHCVGISFVAALCKGPTQCFNLRHDLDLGSISLILEEEVDNDAREV